MLRFKICLLFWRSERVGFRIYSVEKYVIDFYKNFKIIKLNGVLKVRYGR